MPDVILVSDRCDRCGARAAHRYQFAASELFFCEHHDREHRDRLPQTSAAASGMDGEQA